MVVGSGFLLLLKFDIYLVLVLELSLIETSKLLFRLIGGEL